VPKKKLKFKPLPPHGSKPVLLNLHAELSVGFGECEVTRDGVIIWSHTDACFHACPIWKVKEAEKVAAKDPGKDWRIHFEETRWSGTYQRQGKNKWVLIRKGGGFS